MSGDTAVMQISEFLRLYSMRSQNLMWFLGAGASASARVPTATDLMWSFKRAIYCSEQRVPLKMFDNLSDEYTRNRIQAYLDSTHRFPPAGAPDEYAALFEYSFPDPKDRRTRLDALLSGAQPSYGHNVLAAMMKLELARVVWTTNFDRLVEDAAYESFGTSSRLTVADIDSARTALRALNDGSFPLLVKLHGDFQSERLKNTKDELRDQEVELRQALLEGCRRFGLIVSGYSGRDESIMKVLEEAAKTKEGFPAGLFWMVRSDGVVFERVQKLILLARQAGNDAHLVEVETFDELLGDIFAQLPNVPDDVMQRFGNRAGRLSHAPMPAEKGTFPAIRLNALPVVQLPAVCRMLDCRIGGTRAVLEAVKASGEDVIAVRRKIGVIGFGSDGAMRRTFDGHDIKSFDVHQIELRRLAFDSAEFSIVSEALARALARRAGLGLTRRRSCHRLIIEDGAANGSSCARIKALSGVSDIIPGTSIHARPALDVRLDVRFDAAWLLVEPSIAFSACSSSDDDVEKAKDYVRERLARLYNRQYSELLDAWMVRFFGSDNKMRISALGISDGPDAPFTIARTSAFTWRQA